MLFIAFLLITAASSRAAVPYTIENIAITDTQGTAITEAQPGQTIRINTSYRLDRPGLVLLHGDITGANWSAQLGYRVRLRLGGLYSVLWTQTIPFTAASGSAKIDVVQYIPPLSERVVQSAFFNVIPFSAAYVGSDSCQGCHSQLYAAWQQTLHYPFTGCESCHGPGGDHVAAPSSATIIVDTSADVCKPCHSRNDGTVIEAENGFIKSQQQYNEWVSTKHGRFIQCAGCHEPHYSLTKARSQAIKLSCRTCHPLKRVYLGMEHLKCESCHMAPAVNAGSATGIGPYRSGDTPSHIWRIKPENLPGTMYFDNRAIKDLSGPFLTLDIACMSCHEGIDARLYDFESVRQTAPIVH